jgi:hypothetical protein
LTDADKVVPQMLEEVCGKVHEEVVQAATVMALQ